MKKNIFLMIMLGSLTFVKAEDVVKTANSKIEQVTVYLSGAEVNRSAIINLPKGRAEIVFSGLSSKINSKSIQATLGGEGRILSITQEINYLKELAPQKRLMVVQDSLELINDRLAISQGMIKVYEEERAVVIKNGGRIGDENGIRVSELEAAANFYRSRLKDINQKLIAEYKVASKLKDQQKVLTLQERTLRGQRQKPTYEIHIKVSSDKSYTAQMDLKYTVQAAGWSPKYNVRSKGVGEKIKLEYMAEVINNSDIDWKDVNLTLSTGEPFKSMDKPQMQPWTLNYNSYNYGYGQDKGEGRLNDKLRGNYSLLDYKADDIDELFYADSVVLGKVVYSDIEVSELSVDFVIKTKYDIPSDSRPYLVEINDYNIDATYEHFAIPKIDKDAFLIAKIPDWERLNLIEGPANIYYSGTYIGESYINTRYTGDSLEVSLGRDRKVAINRVKREDNSSKKFIGLNRKVTLTYETTIRNGHTIPIKMDVWSQIPVAQESDIEVQIIEVTGAMKDEQSGSLNWLVELEPSETRKIVVSFTIKYPKNKDLKITKTKRIACPKFY